MTYTVTYRAQNGERTAMTIDAANREALFAELKTRGIGAISVVEGGAAAERRGGKRRRALRRGGIAAALVVAAIGVWFLVHHSTDNQDISREMRPAVKTNKVAKSVELVTKEAPHLPIQSASPAKTAEPKKPQLKTYRDERGILRYEGGLRVPGQRPLAKPIELGTHQPRIFKHDAEEHISWLLDMKIGEPVIGDYAYGERFRESFMASLNEPVEILETDDERTRELKAAVQETKEELRARMQSGEDVVRIMNDTMNEYRQLARYKHELQVQLSEIRADQEQYSDQDVQDFTSAANELLKRYGLPPLVFPRAIIRGLRE